MKPKKKVKKEVIKAERFDFKLRRQAFKKLLTRHKAIFAKKSRAYRKAFSKKLRIYHRL